ncbi:hypothetical protein EDD16DRAFT_423811 [Pisolithus croceorrhizus]|nr:hypothetical protein EDD16DRAFT_423811 [Pisolithus croceorrhizus]
MLSLHVQSAQVALSSGYVTGENKLSSIGHTSNYITNLDSILSPSYTSPLPPYAIEQLSGYPRVRESGDVSAFGCLGNTSAGPTTGMGSIPSLHNCTSGQMTGSGPPWSLLSNPLLPSLQEWRPSDDFTIGNIPLPPEQTRTGMLVPPQFLSGFAAHSTKQMRPWTSFTCVYPIPSQFNSSYPTSDSYISSFPSFSIPNQNSSSWSPQEHVGYLLPVHPHYASL